MAKLEMGHVGIHCFDLMKMRDFWTRVMGLEIADELLDDRGVCFLTSEKTYPRHEHHEFVLAGGRDVASGGKLVQQIAFRVKSVDDLKWFYDRVSQEENLRVDRQVSHGNAIAFYFYDPEDNWIEIYYPTGFDVHSPHSESIDLRDSTEVLLAFAKAAEKTPYAHPRAP